MSALDSLPAYQEKTVFRAGRIKAIIYDTVKDSYRVKLECKNGDVVTNVPLHLFRNYAPDLLIGLWVVIDPTENLRVIMDHEMKRDFEALS